MRLGRPLAAASAVAAMTGASLIASPALANSSNRNSPSTPSSSSSPAQPSPAPSSTAEATPAPDKTSAGSSFKITQEKTFVSASTNTSFTVSGTGCTGKQATVGIALYAPDGSVSDVVKTQASSDGSWTSDLNLAALIKSIGSTTATTTDGWTIGAGCMTSGDKGDKTETAQVTKQQQTQIYFDDTRISGSYEVSSRTESQSQTFTFNTQGFYASEKVTVLLKNKSDSSIRYTLGELTADANGNLTGNLPAPTDAADGEYLLVLTGSHHSETATSQTITTVSQHTFTVETTEHSASENNGGGDKKTGGDKTTEQKTTEQNTTEHSASENNGGSDKKAGSDKTTEQNTTEQNKGGGDKKAGSDHDNGDRDNNGGSDKKGGTEKGNNLSSSTKESSSDNRAGGETTTKDSDRSLAHTGANGMIFGGIAALLVAVGGTVLFLRRRNKA